LLSGKAGGWNIRTLEIIVTRYGYTRATALVVAYYHWRAQHNAKQT